MGRAQTQTLNMTDQQLASINAQNQQFLNQQQQTGNTLTSQYQSILNNRNHKARSPARLIRCNNRQPIASRLPATPPASVN
jgi:hypothetical protein